MGFEEIRQSLVGPLSDHEVEVAAVHDKVPVLGVIFDSPFDCFFGLLVKTEFDLLQQEQGPVFPNLSGDLSSFEKAFQCFLAPAQLFLDHAHFGESDTGLGIVPMRPGIIKKRFFWIGFFEDFAIVDGCEQALWAHGHFVGEKRFAILPERELLLLESEDDNGERPESESCGKEACGEAAEEFDQSYRHEDEANLRKITVAISNEE